MKYNILKFLVFVPLSISFWCIDRGAEELIYGTTDARLSLYFLGGGIAGGIVFTLLISLVYLKEHEYKRERMLQSISRFS